MAGPDIRARERFAATGAADASALAPLERTVIDRLLDDERLRAQLGVYDLGRSTKASAVRSSVFTYSSGSCWRRTARRSLRRHPSRPASSSEESCRSVWGDGRFRGLRARMAAGRPQAGA
jgi:hypothetical protein